MRRFALTLTLFTFCFDASAALAGRQPENNSTVDEQVARARNEVRQFAILVQEMKELNMPREKYDFWQISNELRTATKREYEQARERRGEKKESDDHSPPPDMQAGQSLRAPDFSEMTEDGSDRPRSTPTGRVVRMKGIIRELQGLEQYMSTGEFDVLNRYHFLMEEFLELMRDDIRQMESSPGIPVKQAGTR